MPKPKVAFFDFTCCEGCQLCALDLTAEQLLDLLAVIDIVEFREAISEKSDSFDIAIVEGSITRDSDIPRLEKIRKTANLLICLGSCSCIVGINALKNFQKTEELQNEVYPDAPHRYETSVARAVDEIVKVDAIIPGCPINTLEFVKVVKNLVLGKDPDIPTYPVCIECKKKENICVYEKGIHCLGPVIRAGCGAICPEKGGYCFGCRGLVPDPNLDSMREIMNKYNMPYDQIDDRFKLFLGRNKEIFQDVQ